MDRIDARQQQHVLSCMLGILKSVFYRLLKQMLLIRGTLRMVTVVCQDIKCFLTRNLLILQQCGFGLEAMDVLLSTNSEVCYLADTRLMLFPCWMCG